MAKKKEWENALHIYVRANDRGGDRAAPDSSSRSYP